MEYYSSSTQLELLDFFFSGLLMALGIVGWLPPKGRTRLSV
jgi:hypothetical protein